MRFKGLDLNLLAAFDALMATRSVSAAARRMSLSQPAMSSALGRLRDFFGDAILVVDGKRMYPTAFAESLIPQVHACLREAEAVLATSSQFDPATTRRTFRLIVSDYIVTAVIAPLAAALAEETPGIRLELLLPSETSATRLAEGSADLFVSPEQFIVPDQPAEPFLEERHVIVGWSANPLFAHPLDAGQAMEAAYVGVRIGDNRTPAFADQQLALMGIDRRIEVETSSFTSLPWLICGTMRLAFMHERLARRMVEAFPLKAVPVPFDFPVMREMIQYHRSRTADGGLRWMRERLRQAALLD